MIKLSVVIPCFRSEQFIENTINDVVNALESIENIDYELILVSDASPDATYELIEKYSRYNHRIIGIELSRNFGQHSALLAGYRLTSGDYVISMDDDGQTPATGIPILLSELLKGYDVVFARYPNIVQTRFRRFGSMVNQKMMDWLLDKPKSIATTSFFIFNRFICNEICAATSPYPYIAGLIFRVTRNVSNVWIEQKERSAGKSGYSLRKLISLWLNGFTSFSVKPMRISTFVGIAISFLGLIGIILVFVNKFIHPDAPLGYSSMMMTMLLLGGAVIFMLGIVGEYIGRIFISINNPPQYAVRRKTPAIENCVSDEPAMKE